MKNQRRELAQAQWMRQAWEQDVYGLPEQGAAARHPRPPEGPRWPYDDWPLPFASFWTSLLAAALCYPAHALLLTLAAALLGMWLGIRLDRWLRRRPELFGRRVRLVLGVG